MIVMRQALKLGLVRLGRIASQPTAPFIRRGIRHQPGSDGHLCRADRGTNPRYRNLFMPSKRAVLGDLGPRRSQSCVSRALADRPSDQIAITGRRRRAILSGPVNGYRVRWPSGRAAHTVSCGVARRHRVRPCLRPRSTASTNGASIGVSFGHSVFRYDGHRSPIEDRTTGADLADRPFVFPTMPLSMPLPSRSCWLPDHAGRVLGGISSGFAR